MSQCIRDYVKLCVVKSGIQKDLRIARGAFLFYWECDVIHSACNVYIRTWFNKGFRSCDTLMVQLHMKIGTLDMVKDSSFL